MNNDTKTRAVAGAAAVVSGVMLIGTTGLTFALGWALWAVGLAAVLTAIPSAGDDRRRPAAVTSLPTTAS
ncbi:MAG: hypothetical protein QOH13_2402 [Thermoleophilaceae bacterium]|nr:hypothetical protein [Thermoleophilaceae bacterium]